MEAWQELRGIDAESWARVAYWLNGAFNGESLHAPSGRVVVLPRDLVAQGHALLAMSRWAAESGASDDVVADIEPPVHMLRAMDARRGRAGNPLNKKEARGYLASATSSLNAARQAMYGSGEGFDGDRDRYGYVAQEGSRAAAYGNVVRDLMPSGFDPLERSTSDFDAGQAVSGGNALVMGARGRVRNPVHGGQCVYPGCTKRGITKEKQGGHLCKEHAARYPGSVVKNPCPLRRRNSDEERRALERAASTGDPAALERLRREEARAGESASPPLSLDEAIVLLATLGFKSSYGDLGKAYRFYEARRATGISVGRWDEAKRSLIAKRILNAAGAASPEGRRLRDQFLPGPCENQLQAIGRRLGVDPMRESAFEGEARREFDSFYRGQNPLPFALLPALGTGIVGGIGYEGIGRPAVKRVRREMRSRNPGHADALAALGGAAEAFPDHVKVSVPASAPDVRQVLRTRGFRDAGGVVPGRLVHPDGTEAVVQFLRSGAARVMLRPDRNANPRPRGPSRPQWMQAFEHAFLALRPDMAGRIRWSELDYPFSQGRDPVETARRMAESWERSQNPVGFAPLLLVGNPEWRVGDSVVVQHFVEPDLLAGTRARIEAIRHWSGSGREVKAPTRGGTSRFLIQCGKSYWVYADALGRTEADPRTRASNPLPATAALLLVGNPGPRRRNGIVSRVKRAFAGSPAQRNTGAVRGGIKLPRDRDLGTITTAEAIRRGIPGVREAAARFKEFHGVEPPDQLHGYDDGQEVAGFLIGQPPEITYANVPAGSNKSGSEWFHTLSKKTPTYLIHVPYNETMHLIGDMPTNGVQDWLRESGERGAGKGRHR